MHSLQNTSTTKVVNLNRERLHTSFEDEFHRLDFTLNDLDLDKPWAVLARKANQIKAIYFSLLSLLLLLSFLK